MAQWYTQLLFRGDEFLGDSLADWQVISDLLPAGVEDVDRYTAVIVSGYALYGQLHGYYALGVAHLAVERSTGQVYYCSEQSALHREPVETLTHAQRQAVQVWLAAQYPTAWENSVDAFKRSLVETG
jgi:hypothetical protein